MTQDAGGTDSRSIPPSFMPAASRRQRTSGADAASARSTSASPMPSPTPAKPASATASSVVPPSFTPRAARAGGAANASADAPRSIPPKAARARRSSASTNAGGASNLNASRPAPMPMASQAQPAAIPPRAARVSRASSAHVSTPAAQPAASVQASPAAVMAQRSAMPSAQAKPRRRGPKAATITLVTLLLLVLALALAVFGAWNWVDSRLNKSAWLTDAGDTPASTWLILGSDERDDQTEIQGFRTDTILVLTKPKSGASSLISIPRDSLVDVEDTYMKINAVAQLYSPQTLVGEVEQITGQKIDHVAQIRFGGLTQVVDALGGIDLCYDQDVDDPYSGLVWQSGCHTVDGTTALAFSRMRYADASGDFGRNARQRQVISAIVSKASSKETLTNIGKVTSIAEAGLGAVTVDENANPYNLLMMALAFKDATGSEGVSGSVYWSDPDYYVDGVGSSVLLDDAKNLELFSQLANGTHAAGTVGTLAESQS